MLGRLRLRIDADMKMDQVRIDRRRHSTGNGVLADHTIVHRGPDRNAPALCPPLIEVGDKARAPALSARVLGEPAILLDQGLLASLQCLKLGAGGQDVRGKDGDVPEGPCEQRRDHRLGQARRSVLASRLRGPGHEESRSPFPGQQVEPAGGHVIAIVVEIDHDLEQMRHARRTPLWVCSQVGAIGIEKLLIDGGQIASALPGRYELQEAARAVEDLAQD